jgi:branched-chain amino acid transport system permease protein
MSFDIALFLAQDGLTNGAIYALMSLALVLVFAVTRIIFVPQGEFLAYGALTLATLQAGKLPGTVWLLLGMGLAAFVFDLAGMARRARFNGILSSAGWNIVMPAAIGILAWTLAARPLGLAAQIALTLLLVVPLGPLLYRIAYQPIAADRVRRFAPRAVGHRAAAVRAGRHAHHALQR